MFFLELLLQEEHLRNQTDQLIESDSFNQFVNPFTSHWLDIKAVWRDEPDIRLYPEYRLNDYLIDSMQREAYETFKYMVRENLPITTLVDADFVLVNDDLNETEEQVKTIIAATRLRRLQQPELTEHVRKLQSEFEEL